MRLGPDRSLSGTPAIVPRIAMRTPMLATVRAVEHWSAPSALLGVALVVVVLLLAAIAMIRVTRRR